MFKVSNLLTWKWTTGLRWQQHEATCKYVDVLRASPGIRSKQPSAAEGSRWPPSTWMFSLDFWKQLYKLEVFTYSTMVRNYVLIQMLLVGFHMFPPFSLSHPSIVFGLNPVCKDQIGIVYVGVFHHKNTNIQMLFMMEWMLKVQPIFLMFSSGRPNKMIPLCFLHFFTEGDGHNGKKNI